MILIFYSIFSWTQTISKHKNSIDLYNSVYIMDPELTKMGYSIKKDLNTNSFRLEYKNNFLPMDQFYLTSTGPDIAIKLFISLKNTLKNANILINEKLRDEKTDSNGNIDIDTFKIAGKYELKIKDKNNKSLSFLFKLDNPTKISCSGVSNFKCLKGNLE